MRILPDTICGKYHILREIGRGGMGVVYLAEDTTLERRVALKILETNLTDAEQFELRFRQEARTIANLQHPNIVYIHSLEKIGERPAIDMPFIEGGSLTDIFASKTLRYQMILAWMGEILLALDCCHQRGIVHRDVKPSNILIGRGDRAMLTDFGLAKLLAEQHAKGMRSVTSSGYFLGTPSYAPPELWKNETPTPAWDVYATGVVLYEGLSGAKPYHAENPFDLLRQMMENPLQPLSKVNPVISEEMSEAVMQMLRLDKKERPQNAGEAYELLRDASGLLNTQTMREPTVAAKMPSSISRPRKEDYWERWRWWWHSRLHSETARNLRAHPFALGAAALLLLAMGWLATMLSGLQHGIAENPTEQSAVAALDPSQPRVFDVLNTDTGVNWPGRLLLWPGGVADTWAAVHWDTTGLYYLDKIRQHMDRIEVAGYWADYSDESAALFRHGTLSGTGRWLLGSEKASLLLQFRDALTGMRFERSLYLELPVQPVAPQYFSREFAAADFMQPLIYNEVMPRGLAWGAALEKEYLARTSGLLRVQQLSEGGTPITMDGAMNEAEWNSKMDGAAASTPIAGGGTAAERATLRLVYSASALYMAITSEVPLSGVRLDMALLSDFHVPQKNSQWRRCTIENNAVVGGRHAHRGGMESWNPQVQVVSTSGVSDFGMECAFAFQDFALDMQPAPGQRWRAQITLSGKDARGNLVHAAWGDSGAERPDHGLIAVFGDVGG